MFSCPRRKIYANGDSERKHIVGGGVRWVYF